MKRAWMILILIGGAVAAAFLDMPAYRLVHEYIEPHEKKHIVSQVIWGLQDFAQTIPPIAIAWAVWRLDRQRGRQVVVRLVLALVAAGMVSGLSKAFVGRHRPEPFRGTAWTETWVDVGLQGRNGKKESFFSGHSAAAFGMATVLTAYYPPLRPVVVTLAFGCAASRVATGQHWISDVYIGSVAGVMLGWVCLPARLRRARREKDLLQGKLPD